jgi:hypothetical protein
MQRWHDTHGEGTCLTWDVAQIPAAAYASWQALYARDPTAIVDIEKAVCVDAPVCAECAPLYTRISVCVRS